MLSVLSREDALAGTKPYSCDLAGVRFFFEDFETGEPVNMPVVLRFAGTFCWVLNEDCDTFSSTLPYQSITSLEIDSERRLTVNLLKAGSGGQKVSIRMGAEGAPVKKKPSKPRFHKREATMKPPQCSVEDIVEQFVIASAAVGNKLSLTYRPDCTELDHLPGIDALENAAEGAADKMKTVQDLLAKWRAELETEKDGQKIIQKVRESSNMVMDLMKDFADNTQSELEDHIVLLELEYELIQQGNDLTLEDLALCKSYIEDNQ
eukprot:TRINITY_DN10008_c0_g1_i1.p1 TRINITY_DN10008_c0_g1~~TRINITY_DN10008_c0_g1_i1.p1  ORF type:complete len:263 (+),score=61.50 TRINITY_DN10008_c0_g1_i1:622-1410(+)